MYLLKEPALSPPSLCPYIDGEEFTQEYFFANNLEKEELDIILENGWRKFGLYFFRPKCANCSKCLPLRVLTDNFAFSKRQRKILKKNSDLEILKEPLSFKEEYYQIYLQHSERFQKSKDTIESREDFIDGFFSRSCSSFILTYSLENKVIAWGILDEGETSISSVYFAFNPEYSNRSLGNFGALKEIEYAKSNSFTYYYLGYYIASNPSMAYKASYRPHQLYNWALKKWQN
ncbi:arginyltransferase [Halobacteriovorax sp. JY17]|uniref:arginyltransferase n=1 Tax=Halobacteriovorax sp. JY17 TaxID=2014617 RepID=UPI000C56678E|nr:arginyltransferase [Halobacteriovorax sp. JY17]PIK15352.1 MAG: arginyltransferase [Halobacteriovorax sp. JY17]